MRSIGVLIVRVVVGGLLAGHGAQKLFGSFGGPGLAGTAGWLESLQMRPANVWARVAGGSELGGGLLTALGFLNPLGPIAAMGAMGMAWAKVHLGKPVWVTTGGAELPLTNLAVLSALSIAGPGRLSVDGLLGIRVPRVIGFAALAGMLGSVWYGARHELTQGTSEVAAQGAEVEGDPSPSPEDRSAIAAAGASAGAPAASDTASVGVGDPIGSDAAGGGYEFDDAAGAPGTSDGGRASDRETVGANAYAGTGVEDAWTGLVGADAGTAMGTGSELGSETPDEGI
jgi:putative oxidoreductase